jgi:hypothetical protein
MDLSRSSALLLACAAAGCSPAAQGAPPPAGRVVLVELFTSQGCSSCPAADELVRELPRLGLGRDRVVPLTFHVDYWDNLGWKDPFARPEFTGRQQWYARTGKLRSPEGQRGIDGLYTPQMIVDGGVHFSGGRRTVALDEIRRAADRPPRFDLTGRAEIRGSEAAVTLRVSPRARIEAGADWRLVVALTTNSARTRVTRGENGGDTLEEAAIVRALSAPLPLGAAADPLVIKVTKPIDLAWNDAGLTAFVQSQATVEIAGAAAIDVPRS